MHVFPAMTDVAVAPESRLPRMPTSRRRTLRALAVAVAEGDLRLTTGEDPDEVERLLLRLPGIGPWTAGYVRMRALGAPDVFPSADLGVRHALERLGAATTAREAERRALPWAPWRSYALHHLWASLARSGPDRR